MDKAKKLKHLINESINKYDLISKKLTNAYLTFYHHRSNSNEEINENFQLKILEKLLRKGMNRSTKDSNSIKDAQRSFNKYVKYQVNKHFGTSVLFYKQIRALDRSIMRNIKGDFKHFYIHKKLILYNYRKSNYTISS